MGCVVSKKAAPVTPAVDSSGVSWQGSGEVHGASLWKRVKVDSESGESGKLSSNGADSVIYRLGNFHKYAEAEQIAAGWPGWLSAVAGEAVRGWVPLKADSFEKLEKVGQGTYSSVFKARDLETGKLVALKKVRFDNFEPESVRFMAREIQIIRQLDHPNVVKLHGLIASHLSCSIYLVFEYMEHDLSGLSSSPDIQFTESQVKCYMHQLLSGLEHCHRNGVMHRDIKCANLLVNNEGTVKIADFGLANFYKPQQKQPLTSRVVTLWYRPPELLLGSTDYEPTVDLWSVGCVFAELLVGKPILQGRTEVEQLHKIFKLCGSPPDEYWKNTKLPHSTLFKPQVPYGSCLREAFKSFPATAFSLLQTLLSVEPHKRGTASNALSSEYFTMKPYACDPSSLPEYAPSKEIDAKRRDVQRKRDAVKNSESEGTRRPPRTSRASQTPIGSNELAAHVKESQIKANRTDTNDEKPDLPGVNDNTRLHADAQPIQRANRRHEHEHSRHRNKYDDPSFSGPLQVPASSGFAWVKKRTEGHSHSTNRGRSNARNHTSGGLNPLNVPQVKHPYDSSRQGYGEGDHETNANAENQFPNQMTRDTMLREWTQFEHRDLFRASSKDRHGYKDQAGRVQFSGPLLSQTQKVNELLQRHERHIRQAVRRSWFQKEGKDNYDYRDSS